MKRVNWKFKSWSNGEIFIINSRYDERLTFMGREKEEEEASLYTFSLSSSPSPSLSLSLGENNFQLVTVANWEKLLVRVTKAKWRHIFVRMKRRRERWRQKWTRIKCWCEWVRIQFDQEEKRKSIKSVSISASNALLDCWVAWTNGASGIFTASRDEMHSLVNEDESKATNLCEHFHSTRERERERERETFSFTFHSSQFNWRRSVKLFTQ